MATSNLSTTVNYVPSGALQPVYGPPVQLLTLADSTPASYVATEVILPAAGTSITVPVPTTWTHVSQIMIQNLDTAGYCVLSVTAIGPVVQLVPNGGVFTASFGSGTPAGQSAMNPAIWTLRSCDSNGILANGSATRVYIYIAGS